MAELVRETKTGFLLKEGGKYVTVAKTPSTVARYGKKGEVRNQTSAGSHTDADTDFTSWGSDRVHMYDQAVATLERARLGDPKSRQEVASAGGISAERAAQLAQFRAWRMGLDKGPAVDDKRLASVGIVPGTPHYEAAKAELVADSHAQLQRALGVYDQFVPQPKRIEMQPEQIQAPRHRAAPPPVQATPAPAGIEGAVSSPNPTPAPMPMPMPMTPAPAQMPLAGGADAGPTGPANMPAPIAPVAPLAQPQPQMAFSPQAPPPPPNPDQVAMVP